MNSIWKWILIVAGSLIVVILVAVVILTVYIRQYRNPADQKLADSGIVEKTAQVNTVSFHYAEGPDHGPALLLLHAQTLDWYTYSQVLPALSERYHVFAVDYPGHGKTVVPEDYAMTANQIGSDLAAFMQEVIQEPVYATGNSSGGLLTVWLAANEPEWIKAVVLEDPPLFSSEYPAVEQTVANRLFESSNNALLDPSYSGNFLNYWLKNGKEFFKTYAGPFSQQILWYAVRSYQNANPGLPLEIALMPATIQEMLRGLNFYDARFGAAFYRGEWNEGFDHAEALQSIQCPVLLMQANFDFFEDGTLNGAMSREMAERAVALIKDCQYVKVDTGHVVNLEDPDQFIALLEGFFEQ